MRSTWPNRRHLADFTFSLMGRHRQRRYSAVFEMRCGQWMPMIWRYASRRSSSAFVRPHVPMLYTNTGTTKESYSRSRNSRLIRDRLNHTVDSLRKATFASCFRRATSSASPSSDPSLRVMRHSSSTRSACRQTLDRSVLDALMVSDHSARQAGAIRSMSSRNRRDVLIKSVSSAYSTSSGKLASARGRVGRRDRRSRKAASK